MEEKTLTSEEIREQNKKIREDLEAERKKNEEESLRLIEEGLQAMAEGKGVLHLQSPIKAGGKELGELTYDFMAITGREYADAMDEKKDSGNMYKISYGQALQLFAVAAAKQTPEVDARDVIERIGVTDALAAVQLATFFFNASTRAGRRCISKM